MYDFIHSSTHLEFKYFFKKLRIIIPIGVPVGKLQNNALDKEWMSSFKIMGSIPTYPESERVSYIEQQSGRSLTKGELQDLYNRESLQLELYSGLLGYPLDDFFISWLNHDVHGIKKNSLAIVNKNNKEIFLFPDLLVVAQDKFILINPSLRTNVYSSTSMNANFDYSGIFNVLTTLSFALPPPWGVLAAAGVQLIELIIGSFTNLTGFENVIQLLRQQLEQEFKSHDITTYAAELFNYMTQFQIYVSTANSLPGNSEYIENEVLVFLKSQKVTTSGSIYDSFNQLLIKSYYLGSNPNDKLAGYSITLLIQLLVAITVNQRTIIIFTAQLASLQQGKDNDKYNSYLDLWLGEYVELRTLINTLLKVVDKIEGNFKKHRDSLMNIQFQPLPHRGGVTQDAICSIQDSWTGYSSSSALGVSQSVDEFKQERNAFFDKYKDNQMNEFSVWMNNIFPKNEITSKLSYALKTWNEKITPLKPENTIKAEFNKDSTDPRWTESKTVYYAIEFKNFLGSTLSEYKAFTSVAGKAPYLTSIPVDGMYLARTRVLHCKQEQDRIVTVFKDNTTTTFQED